MLINGIEVELIQKSVKHIRLSVHPPDGRVRLTAPRRVSKHDLLMFLNQKMTWIEAKRVLIKARVAAAAEPSLTDNDRIWFMGQSCLLRVIERPGRSNLFQPQADVLQMDIAAETSQAQRQALLDAWYRRELSLRIPVLLAKWQSIMGVNVDEWRIKRMKTRWGTCNPVARRIWLSLELAKKPPECLEYVVVHEMVHFFERHHNARFKALMSRFLPEWPRLQDRLNGRHAAMAL